MYTKLRQSVRQKHKMRRLRIENPDKYNEVKALCVCMNKTYCVVQSGPGKRREKKARESVDTVPKSTSQLEVQAIQPQSITDLGFNVPNNPWSLDSNDFPTVDFGYTGEAGPALQSQIESDKREMSTQLEVAVTSSTSLAAGNQASVVRTPNASHGAVAVLRPNRLRLPEHATEAAMSASMTTVRQHLDELLKRAPSTGSVVGNRTVVSGAQADTVARALTNPAQLATTTIEKQPITTTAAVQESAQTSPHALEVPVLSLNDQALISLAQKQQNVTRSKKDQVQISSGSKRKTKGSSRSNIRDVRQKKPKTKDKESNTSDENTMTSSESEAQETDSQTSSPSNGSNVGSIDNNSSTLDASTTKSTTASKKTRARKGGSSRSAQPKLQSALRQRNQRKAVNSQPKGKATKPKR